MHRQHRITEAAGQKKLQDAIAELQYIRAVTIDKWTTTATGTPVEVRLEWRRYVFHHILQARCPNKINLRNMFLYDDGAWFFSNYVQRNSHIISLDLSNNNNLSI